MSMKHANRGMTLVEVMVAVALLAILTLSTVAGLTFNSRVARLNNNRMSAKNLAQGLLDQMVADPYASVGPVGFGQGIYRNHVPGGPGWGTFWIDEALQIPCEVYFNFKGYGLVGAGSNTTTIVDATVANPASSRDPDRITPTDGGEVEDGLVGWQANEWAGAMLCIYDPPGANNERVARASVRIASNTVDRLLLADPLPFTPSPNMAYQIDDGKTVAVTTRWRFGGNWYRQSMKGLVANYRDALNLGF